MGKFGAFSFHGSKTVTTGEGGMFVTDDPDLYERVLTLSNHGRSRRQTKQFWADTVGYKYKMSNIQAAIGCAQLERIDELIAGKRRVFSAYQQRLGNLPVRMNPEPPDLVNGYWMPTIVVDPDVPFDREALLADFAANLIDGRVFFWPLSMLDLGLSPGGTTPVAYDIYRRAINLPSYHDMTPGDQDRVAAVIRKCLKN
jgi:perosamine synthetase